MKIKAFSLALLSFLLSIFFYALENSYAYTFIFSIPSLIFFYFLNKSYAFNIKILFSSIKLFIYLVIFTAFFFIFMEFINANDLGNVSSFIKEKGLLFMISAVVLAPVMEELFFRGLFIEFLSKFTKNLLFLSLFPSLIFASLHLAYSSIAEILGVFIISIILCYDYAKNRNLIRVILAHFFYNLASILFYTLYFVK